MPLRLVDILVPGDDEEAVREMLSEMPVIGIWNNPMGDDGVVVRVLIEAQHAEEMSDALTRHFGSRDEFRMISLPVEATVPKVEPDEEPSDAEQTEDTSENKNKTPRISREELYADIAEGATLSWVHAAMVALSTVVAAVGLLRGDVAIVIGAMVIAPLLGPNMALALSATLGDSNLARKALSTAGAGVLVCLLISISLGVALEVDPQAEQLVSRAHVSLADVALALAAGAAGSLAFTTGVPAVVVGVMVAVALLPPLVVAGLFLGSRYFALALNSFNLVLINITCINLAAVATFAIQKVRPRTWWEAKRARRATRFAAAIWVGMLATLVALILVGG